MQQNKVSPHKAHERSENNKRLGIKSSITDLKQLFASVYILSKISTDSHIYYSEEFQNSGKTQIELKNALKTDITTFFKDQIQQVGITETDFINQFNQGVIFKTQLEPLQVALELYWKLAQLKFVNPDLRDDAERTGRNRYEKFLKLSINIDLIDLILCDEEGKLLEKTKNLLFNYLKVQSNNDLPIETTVENKLIRTLTIFSEEMWCTVRQPNENTEISFQQEGMYKVLLDDDQNVIDARDHRESTGPYRILKKAIKQDLNYYLSFRQQAQIFERKQNLDNSIFENYCKKVNTYLDLSPRITNLIEEVETNSQDNYMETTSAMNAENKIYYGAPGTGKSHRIKKLLQGKENRTERITFHPEYDYVSFVGGYKPISEDEQIKYKFVPQIFTNIYIRAWQDIEHDYYLVIEEINRGNCAEIFGDIFQLLDRDPEYAITPSEELKEYLKGQLNDHGQEGIKDGKMRLPPNLNILATMNTSDQSLFPMDSAFKRRWDWEYIPINYEPENEDGTENKSYNFIVNIDETSSFRWIDFIKEVNRKIKENRNLGMDKCIGNYFLKPEDMEIELKEFISKAIFYLWNDVFKDEEDSIFEENISYEDFFPILSKGKEQVKNILNKLNIKEKEKDNLE